DIFRDPVILLCSHSFCKDCIHGYWREREVKECPVCRKRSELSDAPLNRALKNLCEAYSKEKASAGVCAEAPTKQTGGPQGRQSNLCSNGRYYHELTRTILHLLPGCNRDPTPSQAKNCFDSDFHI
uniref:RING-type domain-containing protein n=1 Tax=Hucho hucho TaxID=62062 RepID=A0A4W5NZS6_9TELE